MTRGVACAVVVAALAANGLAVIAQGPATLENFLEESGQSGFRSAKKRSGRRVAVPSADEVAAAIDLIRQAYEEEYAAVATSPRRLIDKLVETADRVEDETRRYALLVEAERLAVRSGDLARAIESSERRSEEYAVDPLVCRLEVLAAIAKADGRDDSVLFRLFVDLVDQSLASGQTDVAEPAAAEALAAARRIERQERQAAAEERRRTGRKPAGAGNAAGMIEQATAKVRQVKDRRKLAAEYESAVESLQQSPGDPTASDTVGRYLCFVEGNWADGLEPLAASEAEPVRNAAAAELAMLQEERAAPKQLLAVAGAWWKVAEARTVAAETEIIKRHAADLYAKALPDIDDPIERTLANKRIAAMNPPDESKTKSGGRSAAAKNGPATRRNAPLNIPASSILPAPAELSADLVPLLPTEAEVTALRNHVNISDNDLGRAKDAFLERVYRGFDIDRWSTTDAVYLIELSDKLNAQLGQSSLPLPNGYISGSREVCKAELAARWLWKSRNERDFVMRAKSLPADVTERLDRMISERRLKEWLVQLGPEYASTRQKIEVIDYLIQQGVASVGMRRYRENLANAVGNSDP